jgi:hypothetical protein
MLQYNALLFMARVHFKVNVFDLINRTRTITEPMRARPSMEQYVSPSNLLPEPIRSESIESCLEVIENNRIA